MTNQYFKDLLNSRDLKATSHRLRLLESMDEYSSAMPYTEIQKSMQSMDRVTLYRTIESLIGQGIIHKAFREENEVYYAICGKTCSKSDHKHDHIHFKCEVCNAVTCQELTTNISLSIPGYKINNLSIHAEGVCQLCLMDNQN